MQGGIQGGICVIYFINIGKHFNQQNF